MNNNRNFNPAVCAAIHTVRPGETIYSIARAYNIDPKRLIALNGMTDPDNIYAGDEICIPHGSTNAPQRPYAPSPGRPQRPSIPSIPSVPSAPSNRSHTIAAGDTLYGISRNYGVSLASLMSCNPGIDPYNLQVGSKLVIPLAAQRPTVTPRAAVSDPDTDTAASQPPAASTGAASSQAPSNISNISNDRNDAITPYTQTRPSNAAYAPGALQTLTVQQTASSPSQARMTSDSSDISHTDGIIHTVSENETLTDILTRFNICYHALLHENPGTDFTSDITGISICIPYNDAFAKSSENQPYVVKSGDTLMNISANSDTPTDDLLRMNPCCNILHFSTPGTRLRV